MTEKLRRKDLKGPDEFVTATQKTVEWAQEHPRELVATVLAIVALLVLSLVIRSYRQSQVALAMNDSGRAYQALEREEFAAAADAFTAVANEWSGTPHAFAARAYAANTFMSHGELEQSRIQYEALLEAATDPFYRQLALYNLGILDHRAGNLKAAEERLVAAAAIAGPLSGAAELARGSFSNSGVVLEGISEDAREFLKSSVADDHVG